MRRIGLGLFVLHLAMAVSACSGNGAGGTGKPGNDAGSDAGGGNGGNGYDGGHKPGSDYEDSGMGGSHVDAGPPISPITGKPCKTKCEAGDCGAVSDGCGNVVKCGDPDKVCADGMICGVDPEKPSKCAYPPPVECTPLKAADVCKDICGTVADGCSDVILCTAANGGISCKKGEQCGGFTGHIAPNECVELPSCKPTTCADEGVTCGRIGDNCGGELDCDLAAGGGCTGGQVCGTGSDSGNCVEPPPPACVAKTAKAACGTKCGIVSDGCDGKIDCDAAIPANACTGGQVCGAGGMANVCGGTMTCMPKAASVVCKDLCGFASDGCGSGYTCTGANGGVSCNASAGESCKAGDCEVTTPACTPKLKTVACAAVGGHDSCGKVGDGCGALINCGPCGSDETCGLAKANVCADNPTCSKTPVATACKDKCGTVADGCGGTYACGTANGGVSCTGAAFCGATDPNTCGTPPTTCTPKTCAAIGHTCGLADDGCGKQINCWSGCAETSKTCTGTCAANAACIADASGDLSCVAGTGPICNGALCTDVPTCAAATPTKLTGTVRTPGRVNASSTLINQIAVPNAVVYIPANPSAVIPDVFEGVSSTNPASCGRCDDELLVADGESVLASAVTDYKGEFTLSGSIPVGADFLLVVKVGKWRRVIKVPAGTATACTSKPLAATYTMLPKNSTDGLAGTHLPKIAVSTGSVDAMECVFRNIGVDEKEFTVPSGTGRIHMYRSGDTRTNGRTPEPAGGARMRTCGGTYLVGATVTQCSANNNAGCTTSKAGCTWTDVTVADSTLYASQAQMNKYDMLVWDCEGQAIAQTAQQPLLRNYVDAGGRVFASHFSYVWLENNGTLDQSADWGMAGSIGTGTGYVSLPTGTTARTGANATKSLVFRDFLNFQGALSSLNPPAFSINDPRDYAGANVGPSTDEWVYRDARFCSNESARLCGNDGDCRNGGSCNASSPATAQPRVQQLSFNTPYGADDDTICGRVAYSGFHVGTTSGTTMDNNGDDAFFPGICSEEALSAQEKVLLYMLFDLAACVSDTGTPTPPQCTPKTVADLCPNANDACGLLTDGCGGVVNCGGCATDFYCDGNVCKPDNCTPSTCASLGFTCGSHADGCGGIALNSKGAAGCGTCGPGETCGLGGPGLCGSSSCDPITACPSGKNCGAISDGCEGTLGCGTCPAGQVCGGGGANVCGPGNCAKIPKATACLGKCGTVSDGCDGTYTCGVCTAPDSCGGGGVANECGHPECDPLDDACKDLDCGWVSDGCLGAIKCGDCMDDAVCGAAGPNKCGGACVKNKCEADQCGKISDACGGVVQCNPCPPGLTCGAVEPNKCGGGACVPTTCKKADAECGLVGDGCGEALDCGECTKAGESCGGSGVANHCGPGDGACKPTTCDAQKVECGSASDGCGALIQCGTCPNGGACILGKCPLVIK